MGCLLKIAVYASSDPSICGTESSLNHNRCFELQEKLNWREKSDSSRDWPGGWEGGGRLQCSTERKRLLIRVIRRFEKARV